MRLAVLVLVACSGGSTTKPTTPPSQPKSPGVIWETPVEPWHLPRGTNAEVVNGKVALFGGGNGWLVEVDLETGRPIREKKLAMGSISDIALAGTQYIVVGVASHKLEAPSVAFAVDTATLAATEIRLMPRGKATTYGQSHVAVVGGDGVVITGRGLPLAIYDPLTWAIRATLDNQIGWSRVASRGDVLLAERSGVIKRWNIATNGQRELPRGTPTHLAVADGIEIVRVARSGSWIAELHPDGGAVVPLKEMIDGLAVDGSGKWLITGARSELRVHALPSGEITKRIPVPLKVGLGNFRVFGKHAHITWNGVLRVIDLETGAVTPKGRQTSQATRLAVGIDGGILAASDEVWGVSGGKVTTTEAFPEGMAMEVMRPDDARRYVLAKTVSGASTIELHTFGDKTPATWKFDDTVSDTWIARDGRLVFDVEIDGVNKLARTKGAEIEQLFAYNSDSEVLAVDPDGAVMLSLDGQVAVAGLDGKLHATLRVPHCEDTLDFGLLEPDGSRAALWDTKDLAIWDKRAGKLIAAVKAPSPEDVLFLPKRPEVLIVFDDTVVLWTPNKGTHTFQLAGVIEPAVSADGKKLALSFFDGRLALYDLDGLIASAPLGPDLPIGDPVSASCADVDPLTEKPPEPDDPDESD